MLQESMMSLCTGHSTAITSKNPVRLTRVVETVLQSTCKTKLIFLLEIRTKMSTMTPCIEHEEKPDASKMELAKLELNARSKKTNKFSAKHGGRRFVSCDWSVHESN